MFYVYLLEETSSGDLYTGYTSDLKKRLVEHNAGKIPLPRINIGSVYIMKRALSKKMHGDAKST